MAGYANIVAPDGTILAKVLCHDYRYYLLDNCRLELIPEIEAYCFDCRCFVPSERILTPQDYEAQRAWIESLDGNERSLAEFIYDAHVENLDNKSATERSLRINRQSPPRCLTCGSTEIVQPMKDDRGMFTDSIQHPDYVPHGVRIENKGFASTGTCYRLFTTDGEEICLPIEELVEVVNRCHGKPVFGTMIDGIPFYGVSFT